MANGLFYYKLVSPYLEDVTKNCKLTINEIDSNFLTLKDNDIKKAELVVEDKTLVLTRNNGEKLIVPLDSIPFNLNVDKECGESGTTLTISYDGTDGKKTVTIANILTAENLMDVIGSDILTKVITDGTLRGNGTINSPLGIASVEKTGMYAPVKEVLDLTTGGTLPEVAKLGTRYITKEYVNDYGYLYNGAGVTKIQEKLRDRYISQNTSEEDTRYAWRVPSKADWDALLNSIEPCEYQNHASAKCHVELGKVAGKYLKSECGWVGQPECECTITKPNTGCTYEEQSYVDENTMGINQPSVYDDKSPVGVDKYGMSILPSGTAYIDTYNRPQSAAFKEQAFFWTTTHVYNDTDQDVYVKVFDWNKGGVTQVAECPSPYYSVRLVKDYNGSNYYDSEYIDGVLYKTILFPESGQIWLASNYADKSGFIEYEAGGETPELVEVNNGNVLENRVEMFLNEWNGRYWEKKIMNEADTVVIENPCFDQGTGTTTNICWNDKEGVKHCIDVEIPKVAQSNIEYRVYTEDEGCSKILVNTDDLVVERVVQIVVPMIEQEREERIEADEILSGAIEDERAERESADTELWNALNDEISARTEADEEIWNEIEVIESGITDLWEALTVETEARIEADEDLQRQIDEEVARAISAETALDEKIDAETERAISAETALDEKIEAETERAISAETALGEKIDAETERAKEREDEIDGQLIDTSKNPYVMHATVGKDEYNMILESKDENEEHFIKIVFDGNFGEI